MPALLRLDEPVKLLSVGYAHSFCVTVSNKVYSWVPQSRINDGPDHVPVLVGLNLKPGVEIADIKSGSY